MACNCGAKESIFDNQKLVRFTLVINNLEQSSVRRQTMTVSRFKLNFVLQEKGLDARVEKPVQGF
jgi:hypothetical protein